MDFLVDEFNRLPDIRRLELIKGTGFSVNLLDICTRFKYDKEQMLRSLIVEYRKDEELDNKKTVSLRVGEEFAQIAMEHFFETLVYCAICNRCNTTLSVVRESTTLYDNDADLEIFCKECKRKNIVRKKIGTKQVFLANLIQIPTTIPYAVFQTVCSFRTIAVLCVYCIRNATISLIRRVRRYI